MGSAVNKQSQKEEKMSSKTESKASDKAKIEMVKEIPKYLEENYPKSKLNNQKAILDKIMILNNEK